MKITLSLQEAMEYLSVVKTVAEAWGEEFEIPTEYEEEEKGYSVSFGLQGVVIQISPGFQKAILETYKDAFVDLTPLVKAMLPIISKYKDKIEDIVDEYCPL